MIWYILLAAFLLLVAYLLGVAAGTGHGYKEAVKDMMLSIKIVPERNDTNGNTTNVSSERGNTKTS